MSEAEVAFWFYFICGSLIVAGLFAMIAAWPWSKR